MGYNKKKHVKEAKYIKENKPKENWSQEPEKHFFCQRQQNKFRIVTRTRKLKSRKNSSSDTSLAAHEWSDISLNSQRSFIKSENVSLLNSNQLILSPCAKVPVIYEPLDYCANIELDKNKCSAAWSPFIQMHRINELVSSGQTEFLNNESLKARETTSNQLIDKKNHENCRYQQSTKNSFLKKMNNKLAARALLQPIVRLQRMDVKPITKSNKVPSGIKLCAVTKSTQNNEQIVDRKSTIRNYNTDRSLRSSRKNHQLVQDKILTRGRKRQLQLKKQSIEEIQEISAILMRNSCKGIIQKQSSNNLNNLFPKPLKRETVDIFPSQGIYNDSVRTLPKPIRVKHEISIERIQPIVKIQRLKCMQQGNKEKNISIKQEHITKNFQPVVKLQRLNLTKERVLSKPSREPFFNTLNTLNVTKNSHRVPLETNVQKKQPIVKLKRFKILEKENKNKCMRKSVSIASKNMQPKVHLKRLKLTHENSGNQFSANKLKPNAKSNTAPFLRLKRLQLKYFLQLTSGRFLLTDTCLRKKKKNALKFKPIQVKLEEFEKFDYLINSQQSNNCNITEIKEEIDSAEEQSTLMTRPNQRLRNSCLAFGSNPNAKLNRLKMRDSALKYANFNNSNLISIKTEPVFDPEN